jgi:hypothetical protein
MAKKRRLDQRQIDVLKDLFGSELDEQEVLEKHRVRQSTYAKWLRNKMFAARYNRYLKGLRHRSELLMAKNSCVAAKRLVELTKSKNGETARRACIDIMTLPNKISQEAGKAKRAERSQEKVIAELSPERASKLLAVLAEDG